MSVVGTASAAWGHTGGRCLAGGGEVGTASPAWFRWDGEQGGVGAQMFPHPAAAQSVATIRVDAPYCAPPQLQPHFHKQTTGFQFSPSLNSNRNAFKHNLLARKALMECIMIILN